MPGERKSISATAVTSFVLALVALIFSWIPIVNNISGFALAPLAIVFATIGLIRCRVKKFRGFGLALSGLIIGVASFALVIYTQGLFGRAFDDAFDAGVSGDGPAGTQEDPLSFDVPILFKNDLEVTVTLPQPYIPSESAFIEFPDGANFSFSVTIENKGSTDKSVWSSVEGWLEAGPQCQRIYDSAKLQGDVDGSLPVGRSLKQDFAFSCPQDGELEIFMGPDIFTDKVWFAD